MKKRKSQRVKGRLVICRGIRDDLGECTPSQAETCTHSEPHMYRSAEDHPTEGCYCGGPKCIDMWNITRIHGLYDRDIPWVPNCVPYSPVEEADEILNGKA